MRKNSCFQLSGGVSCQKITAAYDLLPNTQLCWTQPESEPIIDCKNEKQCRITFGQGCSSKVPNRIGILMDSFSKYLSSYSNICFIYQHPLHLLCHVQRLPQHQKPVIPLSYTDKINATFFPQQSVEFILVLHECFSYACQLHIHLYWFQFQMIIFDVS